MCSIVTGGFMSRMLGIVAALVLGLAALAQAEEKGWTVLFRADDPKLWWKDAGDLKADNGFSTKTAPANVQFLRLRRMDTKETIIIPMRNEVLNKSQPVGDSSDLWFTGSVGTRDPDDSDKKILGVARVSWPATKKSEHLVRRHPKKRLAGYRGWGFSREAGEDSWKQTYSWAGESISKTVFEIAV